MRRNTFTHLENYKICSIKHLHTSVTCNLICSSCLAYYSFFTFQKEENIIIRRKIGSKSSFLGAYQFSPHHYFNSYQDHY